LRYFPLSEATRKEMLSFLGVKDIKDLYEDVPQDILNKSNFNLPHRFSEQEVHSYLKNLAASNVDASQVGFFLGAGCYRHYVPAVVDAIIQRAEYLTSYTPYQPEISQGTLQVIFEFQSMICELTGMEVSNASLYDGATSLVEGVLMAKRINKKRNKVVILEELNPDYLRVLQSYLEGEQLYFKQDDIDEDTACVIIQTPDFYGTPHDITALRAICDKNGAMLVVVNTEIISLAMLKPFNLADIVVGEASSLGVAMNFGGPHLGYLATKKKYVRQIPGRICGLTEDNQARRGFVLTLNAREQHIRRDKATSNICSNQGLNVVAFTVHLALLGSNGLKKLAQLNHYKARSLYSKLSKNSKIKLVSKYYFNEFTYEVSDADKFLAHMLKNNIMAGVKISDKKILTTITETNTDQDIDNFVKALNNFGN
jgi:glycine dehydrogenase subunit 1